MPIPFLRPSVCVERGATFGNILERENAIIWLDQIRVWVEARIKKSDRDVAAGEFWIGIEPGCSLDDGKSVLNM